MADFHPEDLNRGHRQRLLERFMRSGLEPMPDYERLELLLFAAIPRRDVKPLAKRLLLAFRNLRGVLDAPPEELLKISGVGERTMMQLKLYRALLPVYLEQGPLAKEALTSGAAVADFARLKLAAGRIEQSMVIYLDNQNKLICYDVTAGTVDRAAIYPRNIAKRVLELNASAVILSHSHPGGDCYPSDDDIRVTRLVADAVKNLDARVLDHVIVSAERYVSLAAMRML
ncbi:MAG: RadC family protein [Victivallaceae bacterium]|nr:DNA repair protein RadC [Victivallaceae bacterium]